MRTLRMFRCSNCRGRGTTYEGEKSYRICQYCSGSGLVTMGRNRAFKFRLSYTVLDIGEPTGRSFDFRAKNDEMAIKRSRKKVEELSKSFANVQFCGLYRIVATKLT